MKAPRFIAWFAKLRLLNGRQRPQVLDALHPAAELDQVVGLIDQIRCTERCCPSYASPHWHPHGHANDLQRFRCRDCSRTQRHAVGPTALARQMARLPGHRARIDAAAKGRQTVGVHRNTAFAGITAFWTGSSWTGRRS